MAWFLHLLDAYDPGRLGRAVDVRTTALDRASRKAGPRCPPDPANPVSAHPAAARMAAAVVAGLPARLGDCTPEADLALGQVADAKER